MNCDDCSRWLVSEKTIYEDGSEVETFHVPDGKGYCQALGINTASNFSCSSWHPIVDGLTDGHVHITRKSGVPWQHWKMGPCPECSAKGNAGDGACHRCAGTGNVRYYDDGYIGEERTRLHPKEREIAGKPHCSGCNREVESDWQICPSCGNKLDAMATIENVEDPLLSGLKTGKLVMRIAGGELIK